MCTWSGNKGYFFVCTKMKKLKLWGTKHFFELTAKTKPHFISSRLMCGYNHFTQNRPQLLLDLFKWRTSQQTRTWTLSQNANHRALVMRHPTCSRASPNSSAAPLNVWCCRLINVNKFLPARFLRTDGRAHRRATRRCLITGNKRHKDWRQITRLVRKKPNTNITIVRKHGPSAAKRGIISWEQPWKQSGSAWFLSSQLTWFLVVSLHTFCSLNTSF